MTSPEAVVTVAVASSSAAEVEYGRLFDVV
jgi:hypothetical protein